MLIRCCGCEKKVEARLTDGGEIYPHRADLSHCRFGNVTLVGITWDATTKQRTEHSHLGVFQRLRLKTLDNASIDCSTLFGNLER